jgi:hypothetical protein
VNVRTGLVIVGIALMIVGAGVTLSAFFEPGAPSLSKVNPLAASNLEPGQPRTMVVWLQNTTSGTLQLNWLSSSNVNVTVYRATDCAFLSDSPQAKYCPAGPAIVSWPFNSSGHWSTSGAISFPFLLNLQNTGAKAANISAVFDEQWASTSPPVPTWIFLSTLAGGIACISLGGVAIFLGLFLRSGVYDREGPDEAPLPVDADPPFEPDEADLDDDFLDEPPE